mmetsp:Transcript_5821/g.11016  ORF Transcript_5821/g.11016 Transcript_5821/m.11016 type:complete len:192 (-) Transcript_5821:1142-1717(-)
MRNTSILYCIFYAWIWSTGGGTRRLSCCCSAASTILASASHNSSAIAIKTIYLENLGRSAEKHNDHGKNLLRGSGEPRLSSTTHNNVKIDGGSNYGQTQDQEAHALPDGPSYSTSNHRKLTNIHELFDRPIDRWELQDWIFLLAFLFIISIIFRILSRIHCCGCSVMDALMCWFCWDLFCDPTPGLDYGLC